jgi:epoxyqueuosine reductase
MAQPSEIIPGAKSVIVIGYFYLTAQRFGATGCARFARIVTFGHLGILKKAKAVAAFLRARGYQAEIGAHRKEAAMRAGLASLGKHGLLINRTYGSWVAYQCVATDAELPFDKPLEWDPCGACSACLRSCPTGALYEPYRVNPQRCVAGLLTSSEIPAELWEAMPNYILGCDVCQEACPHNAKVTPRENLESLMPGFLGAEPSLQTVLQLTEGAFQSRVISYVQASLTGRKLLAFLWRFAPARLLLKFAMKRSPKKAETVPETFVHASGNLEVYRRNALIAAGNTKDKALEPLVRRYASDAYLGPYARWALERMA